MRALGDWIESYLDYTSGDEPAKLFRKWVAIGTIAAAMRRKCFCIWRKHMVTYPNMYILLVGPSGCGKGMAMAPAYNMLREVEIPLAAQSITREALIEELKNASVETTLTVDTTVTIESHSSITIFSKEFAVFLGNTRGRKNFELLMALTDWFDCEEEWTYECIGRGKKMINRVWVNIIGAITPRLVQESLPSDAIGGGLTARMIFVYAPGRECLRPMTVGDSTDHEYWNKLVQDLNDIALMSGQFRFSDDFVTAWYEWYMKEYPKRPFTDEKFDGYTEKRDLHMMKLCMIMSAARSSDMVIEKVDLERARKTLYETEIWMPTVYSGYGRHDYADLIPVIVKRIEVAGEITRADLIKSYLTDISRSDLDEILKTLVECKAIKMSLRNGEIVVSSISPAR